MLFVALAFLGGHCALHLLPRLPPLWATVTLALAGLASLWALKGSFARSAQCVLAATLGLSLAWWHANARLDDRWPAARNGQDVELDAFIASIVEVRDDAKRFRLDVVDRATLPDRIDITWYETDAHPLPGELWRLRVRLRTPHGFANPGGYDYEARLLREHVGATGYVRESALNRRLQPARGYWVLRLRALIAERLAATLPNTNMLGIVQGLAIGETSRMTSEQWRVFANTGTTHLMAISGMHIGMVALLIAWLAGRIARYLPLQRARLSVAGVQAIVGMLAAMGYSALAGFSIPTQRTLLMLCVFFAARVLRREVTPTRGLSLALIGVLLIDPFAPLAPGFWLSFGAVCAIFLATTGGVVRIATWREYGRMQLVATIGLAPLLIAAFGNLSLLAPFVNLLAIPLFTLLLVPLILLGCALLLAGSASAALLHIPVTSLEMIWPLLQWASTLPLALWPLPQIPLWAFALLSLGAVLLLAPGAPATRFAGAMLCLPAFLWQPPRPSSGEFELALLDVGQGLAVAAITKSHALLYDTGPAFRSGRDTGEMVIVPYLHARGLKRIDTLMVSHGDVDHVGGLDSILARMPVARLVLGPSVPPRATSERCAAGQTWTWDGVHFQVLYPPSGMNATHRNDTSCVLRIAGSGGSAIIFGDIERAAERWLVANEENSEAGLQSDIAIVPHHGSRTSSSAELIARTAPRYALVSAGFGNQWGFPKDDVLARWHARGAHTMQTAHSGALEISITHTGIHTPRAFRIEQPRYWR